MVPFACFSLIHTFWHYFPSLLMGICYCLWHFIDITVTHLLKRHLRLLNNLKNIYIYEDVALHFYTKSLVKVKLWLSDQQFVIVVNTSHPVTKRSQAWMIQQTVVHHCSSASSNSCKCRRMCRLPVSASVFLCSNFLWLWPSIPIKLPCLFSPFLN